VSRRAAYAAVAAACVLPRLAVLLFERGDVLASFTEKSDDFARTFVESGTYGFIPGEPSAYTQPLYGFLLVPFYALDGRHWAVVGLVQIALAAVTAFLVYEIARRWLSAPAAAGAAIVATLNPYLVWHDVHVNREIVDQVLAAALVLVTLAVAERPTRLGAAALGVLSGLAILGNSRLAFLPLLLLAYLAWRLEAWRRLVVPGALLLAATCLVLAPWVVRNEVNVGCAALTTDTRALWKANNVETDQVLESGRWIDAVPRVPGDPPTPEDAGVVYRETGRVIELDECEQMSMYRERVVDFWREHPGEKAELAARGAGMLWDPRVTRNEENPGAGTWVDTLRNVPAGIVFAVLFAAALVGLRFTPRWFSVLAVGLLAYQTVFAMVFVGATRYRAPWDFLLVLLAAGAVTGALARRKGVQ
jgi:4-amino-4-deoxy-L-arabinose transferase-like glycosyltransferase